MKPDRGGAMANPVIRRLAITLGIGVALLVVFAVVRYARQDRLDGIAMTRVDTAAVDSVTLVRPGDSAVLVRGGGKWTVNGFPADTQHVIDLLRGLRDTAIWSEEVSRTAASHKTLGVDDVTGRHVRVITGARTPLDLVVGKRTNDYSGVYVRRPGADPVYALHASGLAGAFTLGAADWRDRRVARVTPDSVVTVVLTRGTHTSTLRREGKAWTLNGSAADSEAVVSLLDMYKALDATGFATAAQADSAKLDHPHFAAALKSKSGAALFTLALDSTASAVWARADTARTVYRLDGWQVPRLVPADSALRRKAKH